MNNTTFYVSSFLIISFSGDWKQILPVIPKGTRAQIVDSTLKKTSFWSKVQVFSLNEQMRTQSSGLNTNWRNFITAVGNGSHSCIKLIDLQNQYQLYCTSNRVDFIERVFPNFMTGVDSDVCDRVILTTLNQDVSELNDFIVENIPGLSRTYLSIDSAISEEDTLRYPVEFLNSLNPGCVPNHSIMLKIGVPIIIIRSIHPPVVVNGTRCLVTGLQPNIIEAQITKGPYEGNVIYIPRIPIIPTDNANPIIFKRLQFPVKLAFAMTINRSQGQTFNFVGINLTKSPFTHGHLYVSFTRCISPDNISIFHLINQEYISNPVYTEVLN